MAFTISSTIMTPEKAKQIGAERWQKQREQIYTGGPLGVFYFPLVNFTATKNTIEADNPELSEMAAAATAYFSMLATTPLPTISGKVDLENWEKFANGGMYDGNGVWQDLTAAGFTDDPYKMLGWEYQEQPGTKGTVFKIPSDIKGVDLQNAYYYQINKLKHFIAKMGLWDGVQKTLNEQGRKAQAAQAQAQASKQAAAYAAAMAKLAEEEVRISREEAAKAIAKANSEYEKAVNDEAAEKKKLENIANGLPADFNESSNNLTKWLIIGGVAAAGIYLISRRGK